MRLAGHPLTRVLAALSLTVVAAALLLAFLEAPARAAASLTVTAQKGLSLVTESEALTVQGAAGALPSSSVAPVSAQVVVEFSGPVGIAQVGQAGLDYGLAGRVTYHIPAKDIAPDGSFSSRIVVLFGVLPRPGAYVAHVELRVGGGVQATGEMWLGRVGVSADAVDVAVVWPVSLGVHRDPDGVFFDGTLEDAVAGTEDGTGPIAGLAALGATLPDWEFTLAVEPILLSQLRDMADGYSRLDSSGVRQEVGADAQSAKNAAAALSALAMLVDSEKRQVDVLPYANPSMEALTGKGWRDGLEQMQLGKQVAQQNLTLVSNPSGAYAPDLDIAGDSLSAYARASIDHVLVDASVASDLTEAPEPGAVTARVRDNDNQRVTLVFADEQMQTLMTPPWNIGLFYAGLAAELSAAAKDALVLTPQPGVGIPPAEYLQAVGTALQRLPQIHTSTTKDLVREHSPGSRPVLLDRVSAEAPGYIAEELQDSVETAHNVVGDLAQAAGPGREPVERAQSFLYAAESRYWSLPGTSPAVASVGLTYAERAQSLAEAELAKITTGGFRATDVTGRHGTVELLVENQAVYPVEVTVRLNARGITLPGGDTLSVEAAPGRTRLNIDVVRTEGPSVLTATIRAGSHVLGEAEQTLRFVTVMTYLPWGLGAVVVIALAIGGILLVRRGRKKRGARAST